MNLVCAYHVMQLVCINTGSVYDITGTILTVVGANNPYISLLTEAFHFGIEAEIYTIYIGIFSHCNIQNKWANNAACRSVQCSFHIIGKIWLHLENLFTRQNL